MSLPKECVVDTNVPKTANLALTPEDIPQELFCCVLNCVEAIEHIITSCGLILDAGDEIFDEYNQQLSMRGSPGVGDRFMKWVHDNRWNLPDSNRVTITKSGHSYKEFPNHDDLRNFDNSDRKFVAVANAHSAKQKPQILQATDSKWWGWKDALNRVGIKVHFLCPEYARTKFAEKMEK
jgi:hypothetical protein